MLESTATNDAPRMIGAGWSARHLLKYVALFLGELRDGLTMINMQSAFLIVSRNYTEKQDSRSWS